jgi:hypothetical protein
MKRTVVLLLSLAALACAQDRKSTEDNRSADEKKRLESVTWDLKNHKLIWVIEKGSMEKGEFKTASSEKYEITPDDAIMSFADEKRGFTKEEASSLHRLLDTLSLYCAESVVWWDQGQGIKLDPKSQKPKSERVEQKKPRKPKRGELIAALESAIARTMQ